MVDDVELGWNIDCTSIETKMNESYERIMILQIK